MIDYDNISDEALKNELKIWETNVAEASGWTSAYCAAEQLKLIVKIGNKRGLGFINKFPIIQG